MEMSGGEERIEKNEQERIWVCGEGWIGGERSWEGEGWGEGRRDGARHKKSPCPYEGRVAWESEETKKFLFKGGVLFWKAVATVATVTRVKNGLKMLKKGRKMAKKTQKQAF
jgi:hypothetical protein